jgi:hypothetical protein
VIHFRAICNRSRRIERNEQRNDGDEIEAVLEAKLRVLSRPDAVV